MSKSKHFSYIVGLDLVRFLAASFVVFYHLGFWIWAGEGSSVSYRWPSALAWFGFIGVEVFFTLSGFVIAYTAVNATGLSFTRSRLARLVPGSLLCATLTLITCFVLRAASFSSLIIEWFHSALLPIRAPFIDGAYWTLPIEIIFYLIVLTTLLFKRERHLAKIVGMVGIFSSVAWLLLSACALTHTNLALPDRISPNVLIYLMNTRQMFFFTLIPHGCFFAEGVLLFLCLTQGFTRNRVLVLILCTLGGLAEICWHARFELNYLAVSHSGETSWSWHPEIPCLTWLLSIVLIIQSVRKNDSISSALSPLLPLIRRAGVLTYPLYLVHQRIGYLLIELLRSKLSDNESLLVVFATMFLVATIIAVYCEPPLRRWIYQLMGGPTSSFDVGKKRGS